MTKDQLVDTINQVVDILRLNKNSFGPEVLKLLAVLAANADGLSDILAAVFQKPKGEFLQTFAAINNAILIEKQLTEGDLTDRLVKIMTTLKNRPIVLKLVASLI